MDIPDLSKVIGQAEKGWGSIQVIGENVGNITFIGVPPDLYFADKFNTSRSKMCSYAPVVMMMSESMFELQAQLKDFLKFNNISDLNNFYLFNRTISQMFCSKQYYFNDVSKYLFWLIAIFCGLIAVIGNLLVLVITYFENSFKSPVFITLQSLSAVSLVNIIFVFVTLFFDCKIELLLGAVACYIKAFCVQFSKNMIPIHLSLLSGLRIFMMVSPLKYHRIVTRSFIYHIIGSLYIAFVVLEIIMIYFGMTLCTDSRDLRNIIVTTITAVMFVLTTMISFVQQKSNKLQSKHHRQQSKLASVVIVLFAMIYCPVAIVLEVMFLTCYSDTFVYTIIQWLYQIAQFILFAINPIILFLRNDSTKKRILKFAFPTYMNKEVREKTTPVSS